MLMILSVAFGGAGGATTRFLLGRFLSDLWGESFWATLAINLLGCLIIGFLSQLFIHHQPHQAWRLLFITGFLGSFTTYSTFTLEVLNLMLLGQGKLSLLHISAHLIGGLILCLIGVHLAKWFTV